MYGRMVFSEVAARLHALGMTESELAHAARISERVLAKLASGNANPRLTDLIAIANALAMPPHALLLGVRYDANYKVPSQRLSKQLKSIATNTG